MRGSKSHARNRYTLHKNHLPEFKAWVESLDEYIVIEPTAHPYEVYRIQKYSRSGTEPDIFFYRRDRTDHITVQADGVHLVKRWLKERKQWSGL